MVVLILEFGIDEGEEICGPLLVGFATGVCGYDCFCSVDCSSTVLVGDGVESRDAGGLLAAAAGVGVAAVGFTSVTVGVCVAVLGVGADAVVVLEVEVATGEPVGAVLSVDAEQPVAIKARVAVSAVSLRVMVLPFLVAGDVEVCTRAINWYDSGVVLVVIGSVVSVVAFFDDCAVITDFFHYGNVSI